MRTLQTFVNHENPPIGEVRLSPQTRLSILLALHPTYLHQGMPRGLFIVLEGLDRCGKTTQVSRLLESLESNGQKARIQKFPGGTLLRAPMLTWFRPDDGYWKDD